MDVSGDDGDGEDDEDDDNGEDDDGVQDINLLDNGDGAAIVVEGRGGWEGRFREAASEGEDERREPRRGGHTVRTRRPGRGRECRG